MCRDKSQHRPMNPTFSILHPPVTRTMMNSTAKNLPTMAKHVSQVATLLMLLLVPCVSIAEKFTP